jgi:hypothetical protein
LLNSQALLEQTSECPWLAFAYSGSEVLFNFDHLKLVLSCYFAESLEDHLGLEVQRKVQLDERELIRC